MFESAPRNWIVPIAAVLVVAVALPGCGKKDPEEQFALWSNNEAGFKEMAKFVQGNNDPKMKARALEVLMENGQPSQVREIAAGIKEGERDKVLAELRTAVAKHLKSPNERIQGHAKTVLFDMLDLQSEGEADNTRKLLSDWAFGDMSVDDKAQVIAKKLSKRATRSDIEALGKYGVKGAEILLSKGIEKPGMMAFLQGIKDPAAKTAMINGLRRYHGMKGGKVKISGSDLGFIQRTKHIDGLMYFFEIYEKRGESAHEDDEQASSMAIAAAMQWVESDEGKKLLKDNWKGKFNAVAQRFIKRANCDDRWWAAQVIIQNEGFAGLKWAVENLPDDLNYGNADHANNDVKLMITDFCTKDVSTIKDDKKVHQYWLETLNRDRVIERVIAIRCLVAYGGQEASKALKAYIKARKKLKEEKIIDPIIVPPVMENMTLTDLAVVALDSIAYKADNDKLAAAGKITKDQAKWRNKYTEFTFDRKGKVLRAWAGERADNKLKKLAKKKAEGKKKK